MHPTALSDAERTHSVSQGLMVVDAGTSVGPVKVDEARRVLGIGADAEVDPVAVRATYRRLVRRAHPDVSTRPDAADRTARLTLAYRVLTTAIRTGDLAPPSPSAEASKADGETEEHSPEGGQKPAGAGGSSQRRGRARKSTPGPKAAAVRDRVVVSAVDADTIAIHAPAEEALMLLLDSAHSLGEISYLDRTAGLVEVIVEFVEAPTSSLLFSLQGRADGTTEVFCTVEPLSGGDAPPVDAVTRLVVRTLRSGQD